MLAAWMPEGVNVRQVYLLLLALLLHVLLALSVGGVLIDVVQLLWVRCVLWERWQLGLVLVLAVALLLAFDRLIGLRGVTLAAQGREKKNRHSQCESAGILAHCHRLISHAEIIQLCKVIPWHGITVSLENGWNYTLQSLNLNFFGALVSFLQRQCVSDVLSKAGPPTVPRLHRLTGSHPALHAQPAFSVQDIPSFCNVPLISPLTDNGSTDRPLIRQTTSSE